MNSKDIFAEAGSTDIFDFVKKVITTMTPDPIIGPHLMLALNNKCIDTRCFVAWAARHLSPTNYLEIGIRRGWSLGMVAAMAPQCDIYGFDIWEPNYPDNHGPSNPGPEFVLDEMRKLGYQKDIHFFNGDSHQTVPQFFSDNPGLEFDLILVDGDHSDHGALDDLKNTMPYVKRGGILLFDDIVLNPRAGGHLDKVFSDIQTLYPNFEYHTYTKDEPGVGIAIRIE